MSAENNVKFTWLLRYPLPIYIAIDIDKEVIGHDFQK